MKKSKLILIIVLIVIGIGLVSYGTYYALTNGKGGEVLREDILNVHYNGNKDQVDALEQPSPNESITLTTSPDTKGFLTEINYETFKQLFKTSNKNILAIEKDDCEYCKDFEPKFKKALEEHSAYAYKLNLSNLTNTEKVDLYKYVDFTGTPTTYVIQNGKATHTFTGTAEQETLSAFIEYFFVRNN